MFKMLPPTFFVVPLAWLTILILSGFNAVTPFLQGLGIDPAMSWVVLVVQGSVTAIFVTPVWRYFWRWIPQLNKWVFPDLNGEWDVELQSNWSRIDEMLKAANREIPKFDMRHLPDDKLPPLSHELMRARISQSWTAINIVVWNPTGAGPIKESEALAVQPFRGKDGRHGLAYIFEQENTSDVVSDDRKFLGAARVIIDRDNPNHLCGRMWSDRMWRRGMNTAADIKLVQRV